MNLTRTFYGKVENGQLRVNRQFVEFLKGLEGSVEVTVGKPRARRSNAQNAYYWGVVLPAISEHTGETTERLHAAFKAMCLPRDFIEINGKEVELGGKSSKYLSKMEFSEFVERVKVEAAEMGIVIPEPDEFYKDKRRVGEREFNAVAV